MPRGHMYGSARPSLSLRWTDVSVSLVGVSARDAQDVADLGPSDAQLAGGVDRLL
jgi:hypothetical protein